MHQEGDPFQTLLWIAHLLQRRPGQAGSGLSSMVRKGVIGYLEKAQISHEGAVADAPDGCGGQWDRLPVLQPTIRCQP